MCDKGHMFCVEIIYLLYLTFHPKFALFSVFLPSALQVREIGRFTLHNRQHYSRVHLKSECNERSAVIGSYNIQGSQSQRGCVASASKIPSEYTSVASTKNDNALTWLVIQFQMKNSCERSGCIFIDHRIGPVYL